MTPQGISGFTIVRNALIGDYCIKECIESLLPICDEIVVGDADSTDGTKLVLQAMAIENPKIRIIHQQWEQPVADPKWFVRWINQTRRHLRFSMQLMLDADEVLCEKAYPWIKAHVKSQTPLWFARHNFWGNGQTIIPHGETCGHQVVRFGPSNLFMPSDEPYGTEFHPGPEPEIRQRAIKLDPLPVIFHYGFCRRGTGMVEKSKVNLKAFFGEWDHRLSRIPLHPDVPWHQLMRHKGQYGRYDGEHPKHCHAWLKERGAI